MGVKCKCERNLSCCRKLMVAWGTRGFFVYVEDVWEFNQMLI